MPVPPGTLAQQIGALVPEIGRANPWSAVLALGVLAAVIVTERLNPRIPGALIAVALATAAVMIFGLEGKGVAVLDLDYAEDSDADTDANFVMTGDGRIVKYVPSANS